MPISIKELVDRAGQLDSDVKTKTNELNKLKKKLKALAKRHEKEKFKGDIYTAKIGPSTSTEVDMDLLWGIIAGDSDMFKLLCKGNVTAIRKELGGDEIDEVLTEEEKSYNRISFV